MKVHRDAIVMLRLKLSNDDVQCELVIQKDDSNELITVSQGTGQIILPVLHLEGKFLYLQIITIFFTYMGLFRNLLIFMVR